jgi:tight adherence protein B
MSLRVMVVGTGAAVLATLLCVGEGATALRRERMLRRLGDSRPEHRGGLGAQTGSRDLSSFWWPIERWGLGIAAAWLGWHIAGPSGGLLAGIVGAVVPSMRRQRKLRSAEERLEQQLAEVVETAALAVRSGLSVAHAIDFAASETAEPMRSMMQRVIAEQRVGATFEAALEHLADAMGGEDARLFSLIVGIHAKSGGNLAGALDEVGATIRHRVAARRELRALSAQGRMSGSILVALPIVFFFVLASSSRRDLGPIYRSPAGTVMVLGGLVMEAVAYLWIRHLLRIEV